MAGKKFSFLEFNAFTEAETQPDLCLQQAYEIMVCLFFSICHNKVIHNGYMPPRINMHEIKYLCSLKLKQERKALGCHLLALCQTTYPNKFQCAYIIKSRSLTVLLNPLTVDTKIKAHVPSVTTPLMVQSIKNNIFHFMLSQLFLGIITIGIRYNV